MLGGFQKNAFQQTAYQMETQFAFQACGFQFGAFQVDVCPVPPVIPPAFQACAFQFGAFQVDACPVPPSPIIVVDTHDGGYHKKKFDKEIEDKKRRKAQIIELYEELVELKPKAAADVVASFVDNVVKDKVKGVDFYSMLAALDRTEALYNSLQRELQEIDDEEILLIL